MKIEFKVDNIRAFCRTQITLHGFERVMEQELHHVIDKHRKAAIEEIQKLCVNVAISNDFDQLGSILTITTNEP